MNVELGEKTLLSEQWPTMLLIFSGFSGFSIFNLYYMMVMNGLYALKIDSQSKESATQCLFAKLLMVPFSGEIS